MMTMSTRVRKDVDHRIHALGCDQWSARAGMAWLATRFAVALFAAAPLPVAYYANSFVCRPSDERIVSAWTTHEGDRFPAAVRAGSALGVQFHPEKSSVAGVAFLHAFLSAIRHSGVSA